MTESEILLKKAQKYLQSAAVLLELEDYDSCASRAYFAMFYAAQAALLHVGHTIPSTMGIRSAFISQFVEAGDFPDRAAKALNAASELQEVGDYGIGFAVRRSDAELVLQEAEAFVNSVDRTVVHLAMV
ncbi:MAG TPA: HEPN domain-containing protein [Rhodothermales bacterium]